MKEKILDYLFEHQQEFTSGETLRKKFDVSRTAIWKQMKALKEEGYQIESVSNKGYRLQLGEDQLLSYELERILNKKIELFQSIDSTSNYLKQRAYELPDQMMVLSEEQKTGRGRMGRQWNSPKGQGLFFSILLKPQINMKESFRITGIAAAAVAEGIEEVTGLPAEIKWPNDVVIGAKKVSGILTEISGEPDAINYVIVGIGINVNTPDFSGELKDRATSLYLEKGEKISRKALFLAVARKFFRFYESFTKNHDFEKVHRIMEKRSAILGKKINVIKGSDIRPAKAMALTEEGYLRVQYENGETEILSSGEISVRGATGYL